MRQHNFHVRSLAQDYPSLIRVRCQVHQMRNRIRHLGTVDATLCQNPTDNGILITLRNITTGDNHIVQEEARVGAVLAGIGHLLLFQRRAQPLRLHHGFQGIDGSIESGEVDSKADKVGEFLQRWE